MPGHYTKQEAQQLSAEAAESARCHIEEWAVISDDGAVYEVEGKTRARAEYEAGLLRAAGEGGARPIRRIRCTWLEQNGRIGKHEEPV